MIVKHRPGSETVYTPESQGEHVYQVATAGVLVQSGCPVDYDRPAYNGTDDISADGTERGGLDSIIWTDVAEGYGVAPKGFCVTTKKKVAEYLAAARATERGGRPAVLQASGKDLTPQEGGLTDLCDPDELFISLGDFPKVGPGIFGPAQS